MIKSTTLRRRIRMPNLTPLMWATSVTIAGNIGGKLTGFIREAIVAREFGASHELDVYLMAILLPTLAVTLIGGLVNSVFVPVLAGYEAGAERDRATSSLIVAALGLIGGVSLGLILLAKPVAVLLAHGWELGDAVLIWTEARLLAGFFLFSALAAMAAGVLYSSERYVLPALAPLATNLAFIAALLAHAGAPTVRLLTLAALLSAVVNAGVVVSVVVRVWRRHPTFSVRHASVLAAGKLAPGITLAALVGQTNILIDRWFASGLPEGGLSSLNFASKLVLLPYSIVGLGIATALFPKLSQAAGRGDHFVTAKLTLEGSRAVLGVMVPGAVAMWLVGPELVEVAFRGGAFGDRDALLTTAALSAYLIGLPALTLRELILRSLFALKDSRSPYRSSVIAMMVNLSLDALLVGPLGHVGLALANSAASITSMILLLRALHKQLPGITPSRLFGLTRDPLALTAVTAAGVWLGKTMASVWGAGLFIRLIVAGSAGALCYFSGILVLVILKRRHGTAT